MFEIRDAKENLLAIGDQDTGEVNTKHGNREVRFTLSEGQSARLTRQGTVTEVIRKRGGFIVNHL